MTAGLRGGGGVRPQSAPGAQGPSAVTPCPSPGTCVCGAPVSPFLTRFYPPSEQRFPQSHVIPQLLVRFMGWLSFVCHTQTEKISRNCLMRVIEPSFISIKLTILVETFWISRELIKKLEVWLGGVPWSSVVSSSRNWPRPLKTQAPSGPGCAEGCVQNLMGEHPAEMVGA